MRDFVRGFKRDIGGAGPMHGEPWLPTFAVLEAGSVAGRAATRAVLAFGNVRGERSTSDDALLGLFRAACQASFTPDDARRRREVTRCCDGFTGHELWPALARHIARISTPQDQTLLKKLAAEPEQCKAPLSWGLRHFVRGDLVFDDDRIVTLDELCALAEVASLPLLEDMPTERDIPLGEAGP